MGPTETRGTEEFTTESVGAIVLAGTYHWSGSPFEALRPRPLLPVAQKPLIEYALAWLHGAGVPEAIICANGSTAALRRHLDARHVPLSVGYHEDRTPRGAAGCIKDAAAASGAETLLVTDGTSIPTADIPRLLASHRASEASLTIAVRARASAGQPHLEPTGTYVFSRDVLNAVPATSFQDIKENVIPRMYREGLRIELFTVEEVSPRVLNTTTYLAANRWMIQRLAAARSLAAHPSASVDPSAVIIGPVIIGPGARVHASAVIVGPTSIGAETIVEPGAVVTRSVTWENCVVGAASVVDQCLLGEGAVVPAGSHLAATVRTASRERPRRALWPTTWRKPGPSGLLARPAVS